MKCPACGREMERGWLYADRAAVWTPEPRKMTVFLGKEDVDLTEKLPTPAHVCRACRKVVVEY